MIEPMIIAASAFSILVSSISLLLAIWNTIEIQAAKRSTHSVIPIGGGENMAGIEKKLSEIMKGAGADQGDLNRGLFEAGLDIEDMV